MHSATCQHCGRPIEGRKDTARYCSDRCSGLAKEWRRYHTLPAQRARKAAGRADYLKRWRERKASEGCCTRCGRPNDRPGRTCSCCIEAVHAWAYRC